MSGLVGRVLVGVIVTGVVVAVASARTVGGASLDLAPIALLVGSAIGVTFHLTRGWIRRGGAARLARWALSGGVAGGLAGATGVGGEQPSLFAAAVGATFGALILGVLGVVSQRTRYDMAGVDERSARERNWQWIGIAIFAVLIGILIGIAPRPA